MTPIELIATIGQAALIAFFVGGLWCLVLLIVKRIRDMWRRRGLR